MQANGVRIQWIGLGLLGLFIAIGLTAGGWWIGTGMVRFKADARTVTVKGLVERTVAADEAEWTLTVRRASDSLPDAQARINADREAVIAFLKKHGFGEAEIERQPTRTVDKFARDFSPGRNDRLRYIVATSLFVRSRNVARVRSASGSTEELLRSGVILDGAFENNRANPRYIVSKFNELRPELLAAATRNARSTAEQFAADAGAHVGAIRSAHQGTIQIFGTDGADESGPWSPGSTPMKKIRVVSTFEFDLR